VQLSLPRRIQMKRITLAQRGSRQVLLGFIQEKKHFKNSATMVRSNTRGVYKQDDDDRWVVRFFQNQRIADEIESRRIAMTRQAGSTGLYARVKSYTSVGMARTFHRLAYALHLGRNWLTSRRPSSYLRVMIALAKFSDQSPRNLVPSCVA